MFYRGYEQFFVHEFLPDATSKHGIAPSTPVLRGICEVSWEDSDRIATDV